LLRKAPEQSDKAAVAKFAWHNRERLGLLRARKASAAPGAPADGNNLSLAEAIDRLPAVTEDRTGYERDSFHLSVDADKNRCDTRKEVGDGPGAPAGRTRASRTSSRAKPRVPGCRSAAARDYERLIQYSESLITWAAITLMTRRITRRSSRRNGLPASREAQRD